MNQQQQHGTHDAGPYVGYSTSGAPAPDGPPGSAGGPPAPRKRSWFSRHKILTALLSVVALFVVVGALGGSGEDPAPAAVAPAGAGSSEEEAAPQQPSSQEDAPVDDAAGPETEPAEEAQAQAGIGTPVRDGKFEFTVTAVETGVTSVGSEFLNEQAQGQFVLVHLTVSNIGDRAQAFFDSNQILVDTAGREHSANSTAGMYLEDNEVFFSEINPGNSVSGTVVFDVPADAVPSSIELHDSAFSGGVGVSLDD